MVTTQKITAVRLSSVHYQHVDLDKAILFLKDFGLYEVARHEDRVYFAGFGIEPYIYVAEKATGPHRSFLGGTWTVESEKDLELAAAYPNATSIRDDNGPGGGKKVTIVDPNGFSVNFIYGKTLRGKADADRSRIASDVPPLVNLAVEKPRKGDFRRFNYGPSPVHKLGHYGYMVPKEDYKKTFEFYTTLMNLVPTDAVFDTTTDEDNTCFMHIDLGKTYTDHHAFFVGANPIGASPFVHHSSFEVNDMDTQALGHQWLTQKGYTNCWGIGRHVLGSQLFDYWFDTSGNIIEHYSDGDVVNKDTPFSRSPEAPDSLYIWGPNIPLGFVTGKVEDSGKEAIPQETITKG